MPPYCDIIKVIPEMENDKMKVIDIIKGRKPSLSFEVFPPKTSDTLESVRSAALAIAELKPGYMSVTYGAGGSTDRYTGEIAEAIEASGTTAVAHLSCIGSTEQKVNMLLSDLKRRGVENILALRGDLPEGATLEGARYRYASDLAAEIKRFGGFSIGGACYPEGHPESPNGNADIEALRIKVEAGCEYLTTQMFFDNSIVYNFMYRLLRCGVDVPVVPGIMPVTSATQVKRIAKISGGSLPQRFLRLVDRYGDKPEAMKQAGIAYATEQIIDLYANGFNAVHVYSMNKPEVAAAIKANISDIIG